MKLSPAQIIVVQLMRKGWQMGYTHAGSLWARLQDGGIGKGGATHYMSLATFKALKSRGLIEIEKADFVRDIYKLSALGKSVVIKNMLDEPVDQFFNQ